MNYDAVSSIAELAKTVAIARDLLEEDGYSAAAEDMGEALGSIHLALFTLVATDPESEEYVEPNPPSPPEYDYADALTAADRAAKAAKRFHEHENELVMQRVMEQINAIFNANPTSTIYPVAR